MISRRFSVYLILAVAVMAVAGFAAVAQGDISNYGGEVDYYSDATFSELVGYKIWNCQNPIVWGYRTEYWIQGVRQLRLGKANPSRGRLRELPLIVAVDTCGIVVGVYHSVTQLPPQS